MSEAEPIDAATAASWLAVDLANLRNHHRLDVTKGVGKSLSVLLERLEASTKESDA